MPFAMLFESGQPNSHSSPTATSSIASNLSTGGMDLIDTANLNAPGNTP
jgi:hypothetical protein